MRGLYAVGLSILIAGLLAGQAWSKPAFKPEPDSALADMRGGFVTADGLSFDIGISTSTYINGKLALQTSIATSPTTPTGPTAPTAPTVGQPSSAAPSSTPGAPPGRSSAPAPAPAAAGSSAPSIAASTPPAPGATPSAPPAGSDPPAATPTVTATISGPGPTSASPQDGPSVQGPPAASLQSPAAAAGQTVTASTADGQTTVIQNPSQLINAVTNAASGQDIRLDTVVNVVLPGFDAVQRGQMLSGLGMKIGADGSFGIVSALPH